MGLLAGGYSAAALGQGLLDVAETNGERSRQEESLANRVFELTHVSRPRLALQKREGLGLDRGRFETELFPVTSDEIFRDFGDVFRALAQGWQSESDHTKPVEQVFTELPLLNRGFEVAVRRGDYAHIHRDVFLAPQPLDVALLQDAKQLSLGVRIQVADLVQKKRASAGLLEAADAPGQRTGESATFVAEKLAFQQRIWDSGAIDGDALSERWLWW